MSNIRIFYLMLGIILLAVIGCRRESEAWRQMDLAEEVMNSQPDSALSVLDSIHADGLDSRKAKARYALLKSMALDKNMVDTTEFDVLQPAIDYYLKKGKADDRLRTCYYQGRIYQNRGQNDSAMYSFLRGREFFDQAKDTMTIANLMVAQATIQYRMYKFDDYIRNNLEASRLYGGIGLRDYEVSCLANAMDMCVIKGDKAQADSLFSIINEFTAKMPELEESLSPYRLDYLLEYGEKSDIISILNQFTSNDSIDDYAKVDISRAYYNLGDFSSARTFINSIDVNSDIRNTLEYLSIKPKISEKIGDYSNALSAYKEFSATIDSIHFDMLSKDLMFAQQKHDIEKSNLQEIHKRDRRVWIMIFIAFILLAITVLLYNRFRLSQAKQLLAVNEQYALKQEKERLELEKKNSQLEKEAIEFERAKKALEAENLRKEKQAAEAECERKSLEAENLKMRIEKLENESVRLRELLEEDKDLEKPLQDILRTRMEMLHLLLASEISKNAKYAKSYNKWRDDLIADKNEFMASTRLAYKGLYPKYMEYLESHGLTELEINYICLYTLGLKGTEVGEYIQIKRHYHISSDIRKKLGIDEHETNLGLYVRKLMKNL